MRQALFIAGCVLFLTLTFAPRITGDGGGYYIYLHSIVVDHDLNLANEYDAAHAAGVKIAGDKKVVKATGLPADQYPIGPAILSLPIYLVALAISPSGEPQYGPPFTFAFTLASLLYGALGLALIYVWLRRLSFTSGQALAAVAGVTLATPFVFYAVYDPSYSHLFSVCMVTLFMYLWWSRRATRGWRGWIVLGLVGGVMGLVRFEDGLLMAVTLLDLPKARWRLLLQGPAALLTFSPQLVVDEVIYGRLRPGSNAVSFSVFPGHYLEVLFSSLHGLFIWSPVLLAAVAGYWFFRDNILRGAFAISFVITLAVIGAFDFWYGGASFGMRFFLNLTPFFAMGLAALASKLRPAITWTALALLTAWNFVLVLSFVYIMLPDAAPGYLGLLKDQFRALPYAPHLVQGYVVRSLIEGKNLLPAAGLFIGEMIVVLAAMLLARCAKRPSLPSSC